MKRLVLVALVAAAMTLAPAAANAAIVIDFGGSATGGTMAVSGGDVSGSGIPVPMMQAINTPLNAGSWVTGGAATGGHAALAFDTSAGNNFITVTGWIPGLNVGSSTSPVVLLSGTFSYFSITYPTAGIASFSGGGLDVKDGALLTALGLPIDTPFTFFGFSIAGNFTGGSNYTPFSTDIANTAVPEPGSMMLLGTGLLGLAAVVRRRMRKA